MLAAALTHYFTRQICEHSQNIMHTQINAYRIASRTVKQQHHRLAPAARLPCTDLLGERAFDQLIHETRYRRFRQPCNLSDSSARYRGIRANMVQYDRFIYFFHEV
ncbi:hypothetical protein D3C85_1716440 [compost metagenome]